ncbi:MAG: hypothetical protein H6557_21775 [Lewinellaceae bacterium]|nr:hypothetical protein [Phaeodactylibacter sp.]MCB9039251.1 hypothetical protein [Lewinellaceae bacterium]
MFTTHHLRNYFPLAVFLVAVQLLCFSCKSEDPEPELSYLPQSGDQAIIFTHLFNADDYEQGKQIVIEGFSNAIQQSGQTRRTYFMSRPENDEVLVISFFHADSDPEEWLNHSERDKVLAQLQPLYREPLGIQQYTAERVHDSHSSNDPEPNYLPRKGDEVILFTHLFKAENYEEGKNIVVNDFPMAIENSGQTRRTYFLDDPSNDEVFAASFFHPDSDTNEWLNHEERDQVLAALAPLYREPLHVVQYTVEEVHDTK